MMAELFPVRRKATISPSAASKVSCCSLSAIADLQGVTSSWTGIWIIWFISTDPTRSPSTTTSSVLRRTSAPIALCVSFSCCRHLLISSRFRTAVVLVVGDERSVSATVIHTDRSRALAVSNFVARHRVPPVRTLRLVDPYHSSRRERAPPTGEGRAPSARRGRIRYRGVVTYCNVARDPVTGELGAAVASCMFAAGSLVPWARAGVGAVATQAFGEVGYGPRCLALLAAGVNPDAALADVRAADGLSALRQVAVIDRTGTVASSTGDLCVDHAGHLVGDGYGVQANMMASDTVWQAMAESFEGGVDPWEFECCCPRCVPLRTKVGTPRANVGGNGGGRRDAARRHLAGVESGHTGGRSCRSAR